MVSFRVLCVLCLVSGIIARRAQLDCKSSVVRKRKREPVHRSSGSVKISHINVQDLCTKKCNVRQDSTAASLLCTSEIRCAVFPGGSR
ncbi:hypothetical protein MTO96_035898 [Rhipicephalus appendiculatus]